MTRRELLRKLAMFLIALAFLNLLAALFHWYETLWWFDMPMHFLGGVSVMYLAAVSVFPRLKRGMPVAKYVRACVLLAVALGVLWEVLEFVLYRYVGGPAFDLLDTLSDLFFDLAGISAAAYAIVPLISKTYTVS